MRTNPLSSLALVEDDLPAHVAARPWWLLAQRIIAAASLVLLAPLFALVWLLIRAESRGPGLYKQSRLGLAERPFTILKFRTMRTGNEGLTALGAGAGCSVVTRVGRLLRASKIDELPQLWNVLKGDMEFVGPRPLPRELDAELRRQIPGFEKRYRIRPGLTNIAQISVYENLIGDRLVEDWSARFDAELQYIRRKSVRVDLLLIGMTMLFVVRKVCDRRASVAPPPRAIKSIRVLGVPIACLDYAGVVTQVAAWIKHGSSRYVGICPVHNIVESVLSREHRQALERAGMNTADGMPVVWARWLLGDRSATRVYGPTLMLHLLEHAARRGWRVAFYGGTQDCLDRMQYRLCWRYPELNVVAAVSPPFGGTAADERPFLEELCHAQPQLTFIGLGCPKQERWMHRNRMYVPGVMVGVGAAFAFHGGMVPQAPSWMQRVGLEWAYRLWCEPRRLFRRYATTNPIYVGAFTFQWLQHLLLRRKYTVWHSPD
jgi:N-acetylglucosaminyldiphosphoundecaprenol N-acetyl-beta-D-mannosaminyltransferase